MWGRDERTRWLWEDPMPSILGDEIRMLDPEIRRAIILCRIMNALLTVTGLVGFVLVKIRHGGILLEILPVTAMITMTSIVEHTCRTWVANRRPPTNHLIAALNLIGSVSKERHAEIHTLHRNKALSFAIARRIATENQHLITEANERVAAASAGPQPHCEAAGGAPIILNALGADLIFTPCIDGWYRAHIDDPVLHRMLCAGAAGSDAGQYWMIDHKNGVWGVPATFTGQLRDRLTALCKAHARPLPRNQKPDEPEAEPVPA